MQISIIAAVGKNRELGKDNGLIFNLPSDMKFFKETTMGHPIVMGQNTYKSIGRPLPGRTNIVLSHSLKDEKVIICDSIDSILEKYSDSDENIFIIGGARVYEEFLPLADNIYLTEIKASRPADVFFPNFDKKLFQKEILAKGLENDLQYTRVLYRRK